MHGDGFEVVAADGVGESAVSRSAIDRLGVELNSVPDVGIATLLAPVRDAAELDDPSCIKVVTDNRGRVLYLSRSRIPFEDRRANRLSGAGRSSFFKWVGVSAYRRDILSQLEACPTRPLEQLEGIELLRALEHGYSVIGVIFDEQELVGDL